MRLLASFLAALSLAGTLVGLGAGAAAAAPVNTGHLTAELAAEARGVAPGQTVHVALVQKIQDGWHTYWRNPGDSGEPTTIAWELPQGWTAGEFVWPAPHRLPVGPLVNYGFEGQVVLPVPLTAPPTARPGETVSLKARANFLVCAEICVPESADLTLDLPVTAVPAPDDSRWAPVIRKALADTPKPAGLTAAFARDAAGLKLAIVGGPLKGADVSQAYFFPFSGSAIDHAAPQAIERGPEGLTLTLAPGVDFQAGEGPDEIAGVITLGAAAYELTAVRGPAPAGAAGLGPPPARAGGGEGGAGGLGMGLVGAAAFALLGGLILNLMPCVFPVLAMKAASLAGHGGGGAARREGLAFGAGVLATFLVLAGLLIALKAAGSEIGWGFQLQSPPVVAFLALLMLAVALNLSGVFEVGGSLQNLGSGLAGKGGVAGAFFTGTLAVVVAAPCTAPFMGPALGWALTQPAAAALVVFAALAAGFAAPFVAVAFAPGLLARLPRPGPWMDAFRKALAFPMYAAAAWLAWVLTQQAGADGLGRLFGAALILALAAWLAGIAQRRAIMGARPLAQGLAAAVLAVAAVVAAVGPRYALAETGAAPASAEYEPYTPERLAALQAEGRPVFVNYTAAWCVSCQVNEKVALSTKAVAEAMSRNGVAYLKADWTKKDAVIAEELARFGRAGVPLYLVYGANGGPPNILPSILTEGAVVKALDAAARSS